MNDYMKWAQTANIPVPCITMISQGWFTISHFEVFYFHFLKTVEKIPLWHSVGNLCKQCYIANTYFNSGGFAFWSMLCHQSVFILCSSTFWVLDWKCSSVSSKSNFPHTTSFQSIFIPNESKTRKQVEWFPAVNPPNFHMLVQEFISLPVPWLTCWRVKIQGIISAA